MKKILSTIIAIPIILVLLFFIIMTIATPKSKVKSVAVKQTSNKNKEEDVKKQEQTKIKEGKKPTENTQEEQQKKEKKKSKEKDKKLLEENFDYNTNMQMLAIGNDIIVYDGKKIVKKNDDLKDQYEVRLVASNYIMKEDSEKIYILDKGQKIVYKIGENGDIEAQAKITENVQNIYPLKNSDIIVSYNTNIGTDGILIFDNDMKQKTNINYPNSLISTVSYDKGSGFVYVSAQITNLTDITNTIYRYNSKYELQSINNYKNLVTLSMISVNSNKFLLDPNKLYILDSKYKNVATIEAQDSFENMIVEQEHIYLQDGSRDVKIYDKSGKFVTENIFKEQIRNILKNGNTIIYIGKSSVNYDDERIELAKDIEKSILLKNNKLVLFFKGSVEVWQIPS